MTAILKACALGTVLSLLLLCSCATDQSIHPQLPATVAMNQDAGRSQLIIVTVRLEDGQELPCILDTGCSFTTLDQSLAPKLGKRRDTDLIYTFDGKHEVDVYPAPKLYLGGARLRHGTDIIFTCDCQRWSAICGRPVLGIVGLDVMENYCLQLDFASHEIRFLDPDTPAKGLGQPFVLTTLPEEGIYFTNNFVGSPGSGSLTRLDLGCRGDGWLVPGLFQQWTNQALPLVAGQVHCPEARLGGEIYPAVWFDRGEPWAMGEPEHNGLGLFLLARHLVTLDFPKRTMYLKRTRIGPQLPTVGEGKAEANSALTMLHSLKESGHLPGWPKGNHGVIKSTDFSWLTGSFVARKTGDPSVYHYQVIRASEASPWKLRKAWRTDADGKTIEEFPVP
jgi:hypothetical protein